MGSHAGVWASALQLRNEAWVPLCSLSPDVQWTSVLEILGMPTPSGQVRGHGWHGLSRAGMGCISRSCGPTDTPVWLAGGAGLLSSLLSDAPEQSSQVGPCWEPRWGFKGHSVSLQQKSCGGDSFPRGAPVCSSAPEAQAFTVFLGLIPNTNVMGPCT